MKRAVGLSTVVLVTLFALFGVVAVGLPHQDVSAQDVSTQDHALVGAWLADTSVEDPENSPSVIVFHSDGTYTEVTQGEDGVETTLGAWQATGANTAQLTIVSIFVAGEGVFGTTTVRADVTVSEDGNSFDAPYTLEISGFPGVEGEYGPATATGTRIVVEVMGTPVGAIEDLFAEEEGTPEATPEA